MRAAKARGEQVLDRGLTVVDDTDSTTAHRRVDHVLEVTLRQLQQLLTRHRVPADVRDYIVGMLRRTFQAQILYLRRQVATHHAAELYWSAPGELARDPHLMALFEESLACAGADFAAHVVADLHRRYPARPVLVKH